MDLNLINYLSNHILGLEFHLPDTKSRIEKKEYIKQYVGVLALLSNLSNPIFEHTETEEISLSYDLLDSLFGRGKVEGRFQNKWQHPNHLFSKFFSLEKVGNSIEHVTSSYKVDITLLAHLVRYQVKNQPKLLEYNLKEVIDDTLLDKTNLIIPNSIREPKKPIPKENQFLEDIELNTDFIREHIKDLRKQLNEYCNEDTFLDLFIYKQILFIPNLKNKLSDIFILQEILQESNNGIWTVLYEKHPYGREYSKGLNPQTLKKSLRKIVLQNYKESDIEIASPTILSQIYEKITGKKTPKTIEVLINYKEEVRLLLAYKLGISYDKAKEILTSLFFGAKIPKEYQIGHGFSSIDAEILKGMDSASRELIKHEYLKILHKDITTVFEAISSHYRTAEIEKLIKDVIKKKKVKRKTIRTKDIVTVVYQTEENKILISMIDYLKSKGIIYFVRIHDAVMYLDLNNTILEQEMEKYVLERTGYRIKFSSSTTQDDTKVETLCKVMGVDIKSCGLIVSNE